jgi:subtilase family serine protease
MMDRPRVIRGSALVLTLAFAACSGGGGGGGLGPTVPANPAVPAGVNQGAPAATALSQTASAPQAYHFPESAPAGVRVYVHLPLRNSAQLDELIAEQSTQGSPLYHHWLTPAQFRAEYGPTPQSLQTAASTLQALGFKTTLTSQGVVADAPQATVERAFAVRLSPRAQMLGRTSDTAMPVLNANTLPTLPAALAQLGAHVAAFAPLPPMHTDHMAVNAAQVPPQNRYGPYGGYWFDDLKQAYAYPSYTSAKGAGTTIAILAVSNYLQSDMQNYFSFENMLVPQITLRPVDGGPQPFNPGSGYSAEVTLDIQQAGGSAPGAHIIVYGAPDASITPSFLDMYTAVVDDDLADVVSTSFGLCELYFTAPYNGGKNFTYLFQDFHDIFRQGNAEGMTFVNASGDNGAYGCTDPTGSTAILGVEWPSNDPDVTGVGGTNLQTSYVKGSTQSTYVSENDHYDVFAPGPGVPTGLIWGSGGGMSTYWGRPPYQQFVNTRSRTRTVPDLAMHMGGCPVGSQLPCSKRRSYDIVGFAGGFYGFIGTSASAPEFAGLQAVADGRLGSRAGNANYTIYSLAAAGSIGGMPVFHNDIYGTNGYPSTPGYNYVVGNGTPYAAAYALDPMGPFAGNPQTPSNP